MTRNTVLYYIKKLETDAKAASAELLEDALASFWKKSGLSEEKLARTPLGKPYFPSGRVHLSVTHTGPFYALCFSPRPIGIDAEKVGEKRERIANKFSPEERKLPFSYVWCGKEAVAKLVGKGLGITMQVSVSDSRAEYGGKRYCLREDIFGEYRLLTATEEGWDYGAEALSEK